MSIWPCPNPSLICNSLGRNLAKAQGAVATMPAKRRSPKPRFPQSQGRQVLGVALVLSALALVTWQQSYTFDNGAGGLNWQIGAPLTTVPAGLAPRSTAELRAYALRLVNRDRQLNGLTPLTEDPILSQAAQLHAEDMLARGYFDHISPDGRTPSDRFRALGGATGAGENISHQAGGLGYASYRLVESFQKGWMYSPGHRENLLAAHYQAFGYGLVISPWLEVYAVQKFY